MKLYKYMRHRDALDLLQNDRLYINTLYNCRKIEEEQLRDEEEGIKMSHAGNFFATGPNEIPVQIRSAIQNGEGATFNCRGTITVKQRSLDCHIFCASRSKNFAGLLQRFSCYDVCVEICDAEGFFFFNKCFGKQRV